MDSFRLIIAGNFIGRRAGTSFKSPDTFQIDKDTLEKVLGNIGPDLSLEVVSGTSPVTLKFREIDDFHPDQLLGPLEKWLDQHGDALQSVEAEAPPESPEKTPAQKDAPPPPLEAPAATDAGLLDQILDASESGPKTEPRKPLSPKPLPDDVMESIVAPHRVAKPDPRDALLRGNREARLGELLRRVLHHPEFQALESIWRGLRWLVRNVETGPDLQIFVRDMTKADISDPDAAKALFRSQPGDPPWTVVIALHSFHPTASDVTALTQLAEAAAAAGTPFMAGATDAWIGCDRLADIPDPDDWEEFPAPEGWKTLQERPEAPFLGLALPRFLLRLPYGAETEPVDALDDFEEMAAPPRHEDLLWGHPGLACARLLCEAFNQNGWNFRPGDVLDIEDLPVYVYRQGIESRTIPCAEAYLSERAAVKILEAGFMPLLSFKNQDRIRLARFQSVEAVPVVR